MVQPRHISNMQQVYSSNRSNSLSPSQQVKVTKKKSINSSLDNRKPVATTGRNNNYNSGSQWAEGKLVSTNGNGGGAS